MFITDTVVEKFAFCTKEQMRVYKNTLRLHEINADWETEWKNIFLKPSSFFLMQGLCYGTTLDTLQLEPPLLTATYLKLSDDSSV